MTRILAVVVLSVTVSFFVHEPSLAQTKGETQQNEQGKGQSGKSQGQSQTEERPAGQTAASADVACFGTKYGLSCLTADGWQTYTEANGLPHNRIYDITVCDGRFLIAVGSAVVTFDGESFGSPNQVPSGSARDISCEGNGRYWVNTSRAAAYWNGSGWQIHSREQIVPNDRHRTLNGVAAGPNGTAWVTVFRGRVAHFDGQAWTLWGEGSGFQNRNIFREVIVARNGQVYVPGSRGLFTFQNNQWVTVPGIRGSANITEDADGNMILSHGTRVLVFDGSAFQAFEVPHSARMAARDSQGRIWVATEFGGALVENGEVTDFQMHNSSLVDNDVTGVHVLGAGGTLPDPITKETGSLTGRFEWRDGPPVANVRVQVCGISRGLIYRNRDDGPCAGRPLYGEGTTDDSGEFTIENLQSAHYRIAVQVGDRWVRYLTSGDRTRVLPREAKNMGTLRVHTRYREGGQE